MIAPRFYERLVKEERVGMDKMMFLEAVRSIPDKFIDDETDWCVYGDSMIIANKKFPPMVFNTFTKEWRNLSTAED